MKLDIRDVSVIQAPAVVSPPRGVKLKAGRGRSGHRDSSNQRAAVIIVSSDNRGTDPSLDYCHRLICGDEPL